MADPESAGDPIPAACEVIEVRVAELRHLFNAIDPSPFRERDLDPAVADFIVEWARELPARTPLGLAIHLGRSAGTPDEARLLRDAVHDFFGGRAAAARRRLRELFRRGRLSLVVGLAFLALFLAAGQVAAAALSGSRMEGVISEGLLIVGWVAMWRPLEVFLYDWWPIRAEARGFDRLAAMPVRIVYEGGERSEAWRSDWPARRGTPSAAVATRTAG